MGSQVTGFLTATKNETSKDISFFSSSNYLLTLLVLNFRLGTFVARFTHFLELLWQIL